MNHTYKTQGVCSKTIDLDIDENGNIRDVNFEGGCNGNAKGVSELVKGRNAKDVAHLLEGIQCAGRASSCPDQLSRALKEALESQE